MATIWAQVENGEIVESASQASLSKKTTAEKNGMDKDAFLQLLVAQMRYQDPLEPTSNTEYISQYAQFSQVEQMQNMAATSELARATSLVGQEVYIKTTDSTGNLKYIRGNVDYVMIENGKAYLSINEQLYSLDDLDTVADSKYLAAYDKALDFSYKMNKLPGVNAIDMTYAKQIDELEEIYNNMNDYEKSFVAKETVDKLNKYVEKLKEVRARAEAADFSVKLAKLPDVSSIDLTHADQINELEEAYNSMSDYVKGFIEQGSVDKLNEYIEKIKELRSETTGQEQNGEETQDGDDSTDVEGTEETE